jgi:muramoyltetrapeptide carboxypeptidase
MLPRHASARAFELAFQFVGGTLVAPARDGTASPQARGGRRALTRQAGASGRRGWGGAVRETSCMAILRKPKQLVPGDTIGLVSPSGPTSASGATTPEHIEATRRRLLGVGFRTVVAPHALEVRGYLAGSDAGRVADLHAMFGDPSIDAILCIRGGYGAHRLLDALDYDLLRAHPKVFIGYSDITALHLALHTQCQCVTFHGPMATALSKEDPHDFVECLRAVGRSEPLGALANPPGAPPIETLVAGVAEGELIGGNAALLTALLGTRFQPEFRGRLLFLEDLGDRLYRLDRKLAQLRLASVLDQVAGIIVGECRYPADAAAGLTLREILDDFIVPAGKPAIYGLACGHGAYHLTLPVGVRARLDASRGIVTVVESGVSLGQSATERAAAGRGG